MSIPPYQKWTDIVGINLVKHIVELNNTINQLDMMDVYRLFTQQQQNTHSSEAHMDHSPR